MKILIVTRYHTNFPDGECAGGDETVHRMMQRIFEKDGHTVHFLGQEDADKLGVNRAIDRLLGHRYLLGTSWYTSQTFKRLKDKYDLVICNSVCSWGINHPHSVVLFHFSSTGALELYSCWRDLKKYLAFWRWAAMERIGSSNKIVIAVSDFLKAKLLLGGIRTDNVIHNGIDIEQFRPIDLNRSNSCLFVGRYDHYLKGFDILEKLAAGGIAIDCCTNIDPGNGLNWLGNLKHSDMPVIYNSYKIVLFPSRYESVGLVPLEAMACGVPVIMGHTGVGTELCKTIPEFVVSGWSDTVENEYMRRMEIINSNYDHYSHLARKFVVQNYSYEIFKEKWLELIR